MLSTVKFFTRKPTYIKSLVVSIKRKKHKVKIFSFLKHSHASTTSFGFQWERYAHVQIDRLNHTSISKNHLQQIVGFPLKSLQNQTVLEIGSGAGRYTDVLQKYAKHVITVDPSAAIEHNAALGAPNVTPVQADIFDLPINAKRIDLVYCRGVLQHTKNPKLAIKKLFSYVKKGGFVAFDIYPKTWRTLFFTKYYLRPFTKRIPKQAFAMFLEKNIPWMLLWKSKYLNPLFPNVRYIRDIPNILFPIADYTRYAPLSHLTEKQHIELCILDTFDMYTPEYDIPLSFTEVLQSLPKNTKVIKADRDQFQFVIQKTS